ncbi:serine/threonine protein kinase [Micromonospora aurantiaca]|uniref:non-specific serine/threonine protein kinase n=2 Tax=Micromonospora aurantiaca (nom. illeg.) TaxID=47850 RepID=A0A6N3KC52_9ACTN|nr:serine/threonine protein kinase [Micromonospora aurantiaca]
MGEVWGGRDIKLDREVAVKFIRFPEGTPDKDLIRRFVRESRITARLEHPGVPAIYDVGTHDERPYLVMQRIRGISVADLIAEQGSLPIGWATAIAAQTCAVLSVAHQASLIHRDLKPNNLILEGDGSVKVLDFGLAVALDVADFSKITRTGQSLGTPAYMAPEQIMASMSSPQTDLYALGCTLHEMLTGQPVFAGPTAYAVMNRQVQDRPRSVRALRSDVPAELEQLLLALLEKKPEERPASADAVYQQLLPFATELQPLPGVLSPPTTPSPLRMYASVLSRVYTSATATGSGPVSPPPGRSSPPMPRPPSPPESTDEERSRFSRSELDRARSEASRLVKQSRYSQAAEVLAALVEPATRVFGRHDDDVASLRLELANVLFDGGDYRSAAPAYHQLAADLATRHGADAELVFDCRLKEATSHALIGQTSLALRQLGDLLQDQQRVFGETDSRVFELRKQIGLLHLGAGQGQAAEQTLTQLMADRTRRDGSDHPAVTELADLLTNLRRAQ